MKMQSKPTIALASGVILIFGVLCQTAQAQSVLLNTEYTGDLVLTGGSGPAELSVGYEVTDNSGVYTYDYTIAAPGVPMGNLSVDFNTTATGAAYDITGSTTGAGSFYEGGGATGTTVAWFFSISASQSATLSFESIDAPVLGNASAGDAGATWGSNPPEGDDLAVPASIPEPSTTALLALSPLLLLAFRSNVFKKS